MKYIQKQIQSYGVILTICFIISIGSFFRLSRDYFPHYDDKDIIASIEHMMQFHTLDTNFYNHPNQTGLYMQYSMLSIVSYVTYHTSLANSYEQNKEFYIHCMYTLNRLVSIVEIPIAIMIGVQFSTIIGVTYGLLTALFPSIILHSGFIRVDSLFNVTWLLCILSVILLYKKQNWQRVLWCAIAIALATATKYPGILSMVGLIPLLLLTNIHIKEKIRYIIIFIATFIIAFSLFAPFLIFRVHQVIEIFQIESRNTSDSMEILGFIGNMKYYMYEYRFFTNISIIALGITGLLYGTKKYRILMLPTYVFIVLYLCLSAISLHWSRWGLPFFSGWLLFSAMGIEYVQKKYTASIFWLTILVCIICISMLQKDFDLLHHASYII